MTTFSKEDAIKKFARFGIFTKGLVYLLIGVLTAMAAFGMDGGEKAGKTSVFQFVLEQPYGKILLGLIGLGLIGYLLWRFTQAIKNPEDKGWMSRIGYAFSGAFYGIAAFTAIKMIFSGGGGNSSDNKERMIGSMLEETWGQIAIGAIAVIFFGKALWQFYRALSGKFSKKIKDSHLNSTAKSILMKIGLAGYISRGIVIGIIGYLFLKAAIQANPSGTGGTEQAFQLLQTEIAGPIVLAVVALGLAAYGLFMVVKGVYRVLPEL